MREFSTPLVIPPPTTGSITDDIIRNAREHPESVAFCRRTDAAWEGVTADRFHTDVRAVAKGLVAAGVEAGDRVAMLSRNRYEWTLFDYAIWYAGAVSVPVYETSSPAQVEWILENSGAVALVLESVEHVARLDEVRDRTPRLKQTWVLDDGAVERLTGIGEGTPDGQLDRRQAAVTPTSVATIIYTSGTTGDPRGCTLTHGNLMSEVAAALDALDDLFAADESSTVLFLPLAHVFSRVIQVGCVRARVRLGHSADAKSLAASLGEFRPTFILAVPRIFEKLFNTASQRARIDGKGSAFDKAVDAAIAYSRAIERGRPGPVLRARHAVYDRLVYTRIRESLGGACDVAISGGAPLGERLAHFYRGAGITVYEGYGLTETTAAVTVNRPGAARIGTVGQALGGTTVKVASDGELLVRGPQVMLGYWQDDAATSEVIDPDGWLHTGDLAEIDDEGFVRITGRCKEILVTAGGKNVAPADLEDHIRAHELVSQCIVVGDGRPFVAALVTLDPDAAARWASEHGKPPDMTVLSRDPDLRAEVQRAIDDANAKVSQAESIRKFLVLGRDWSEETGELTPSLKVRRSVVMRTARGEIERLYGQ